jgi:hypothetical protein
MAHFIIEISDYQSEFSMIGESSGRLGSIGGALIGDQIQARQKQDEEVQRRMAAQQAEIERQQRELDRLKAQQQAR